MEENLSVQVLKDGRYYIGQINSDSQPHGKGYAKSKHGGRYYGNFFNGLKQGQGLMLYPGGQQYMGEFSNDERNGCGITIEAHGQVYCGQWKDDSMNGVGFLMERSGDITFGQFQSEVATSQTNVQSIRNLEKATREQFPVFKLRFAIIGTVVEAIYHDIDSIEVGRIQKLVSFDEAREVDANREKNQTQYQKDTKKARNKTNRSTRSHRTTEAYGSAEEKIVKNNLRKKRLELQKILKWDSIRSAKLRKLAAAKKLLERISLELEQYNKE